MHACAIEKLEKKDGFVTMTLVCEPPYKTIDYEIKRMVVSMTKETYESLGSPTQGSKFSQPLMILRQEGKA